MREFTPATLPTVITGIDVEQAVHDTLKPRLDYYLPQLGYPKIKGWVYSAVFDKFPEDQVPLINIQVPGLFEDPVKYGFEYIARWTVICEVFVSAKTENDTRKMSRDIGAMIRAALVQEPGLHGFARAVDWVGEDYGQLPVIERRTKATAEIDFIVEVAAAVSTYELPFMPEGPPPTPGPLAHEAETEVMVIPKPVVEGTKGRPGVLVDSEGGDE
jgi:hypothetical protein